MHRVSRDGRQFALKVPLTGIGSPSAEELRVTEARILREVVALMTLKHPGIVGVHGYDRWPDPVTGALYLVMDFVDGKPMTHWRQLARPSLREIVEAFRLLALAIHEMHAMGVVHRDIKSSNVLVKTRASEGHSRSSSTSPTQRGEVRPGTNDQPYWQPVLVDFGLARPTYTANVTREHVLVGTEGRWAPELLATTGLRFDYTALTDLFSLGHLFYEVLTGNGPSHSHTTGKLVTAGRDRLYRPSDVRTELLPALDVPVLRLLAEDPKRRTPSGRALADELNDILASTDWDDISTYKLDDIERRFARTRAEGPRAAPPLFEAPPTRGTVTRSVERPTLPMLAVDLKQPTSGAPPPGPSRSASTEPSNIAAAAPAPTVTASRGNNPRSALRRLVAIAFAVLVVGRLGKELSSSAETPDAPALAASATDGGTASRPEARPAEQLKSRAPPAKTGQLSTSRSTGAPNAAQGRALVRAALVGHVRSGATQAVLRQPVLLASTALPTGATLDGTADELPDGRFLLRFDSVRRSDGSVLRLNATAVVDASAATRRPLMLGASRPGFEFDLTLAAAP